MVYNPGWVSGQAFAGVMVRYGGGSGIGQALVFGLIGSSALVIGGTQVGLRRPDLDGYVRLLGKSHRRSFRRQSVFS